MKPRCGLRANRSPQHGTCWRKPPDAGRAQAIARVAPSSLPVLILGKAAPAKNWSPKPSMKPASETDPGADKLRCLPGAYRKRAVRTRARAFTGRSQSTWAALNRGGGRHLCSLMKWASCPSSFSRGFCAPKPEDSPGRQHPRSQRRRSHCCRDPSQPAASRGRWTVPAPICTTGWPGWLSICHRCRAPDGHSLLVLHF